MRRITFIVVMLSYVVLNSASAKVVTCKIRTSSTCLGCECAMSVECSDNIKGNIANGQGVLSARLRLLKVKDKSKNKLFWAVKEVTLKEPTISIRGLYFDLTYKDLKEDINENKLGISDFASGQLIDFQIDTDKTTLYKDEECSTNQKEE